MINSFVNGLLLLPVLYIGHSKINQYTDNKRKRKAKEELLMIVNTGFTNLRQTANLHSAISSGTKKKIIAKSHAVQEMLVSTITRSSDPNTKKIIALCESLDKKNHKLEQNASEINNAKSDKEKKIRQSTAKNLSVEILTELEKAQSNDSL